MVGGCAEVGAYVPAVTTVLKSVRDIVKKRVGKELEDLPMVCEQEFDPGEQKVYVLCEVDVSE